MRRRELLFLGVRAASVAVCAGLASLLAACPESTPRARRVDAGHDAGVDAGRVGRRDAGLSDGGYSYDVFHDPGCDGGLRPTFDGGVFMRECDPYDAAACGPGYGCYPYVSYPEGACGEEVFVTQCAPLGPGTQGDDCIGTLDCAPGFACFVTGEGNQCLQLCDQRGGVPHCPRGLICGWTDLPEFGACN